MTEEIRDSDPLETQEWCESLGSVLEFEGLKRAHCRRVQR
jgi:pyruvate dehydrogenase complex dehydrogenase (E1) component